jgi:Asp-tRNA(Asn)/Glu-tRNA(Gln) amidotransferase A subunit family amidase
VGRAAGPRVQYARLSARRAALPDRRERLHADAHDQRSETPYQRGLVYPSVATLAGQPATAFPLGRSREGLPIGLQALGPYLEDLTPIRFAALLAREIGGFTKPEGYDA